MSRVGELLDKISTKLFDLQEKEHEIEEEFRKKIFCELLKIGETHINSNTLVNIEVYSIHILIAGEENRDPAKYHKIGVYYKRLLGLFKDDDEINGLEQVKILITQIETLLNLINDYEAFKKEQESFMKSVDPFAKMAQILNSVNEFSDTDDSDDD
jgi:hypothetical protein